MLGGVVLLVIAAVGGAYGLLVRRAAPHRHDHIAFGRLALLDAAITAWCALHLLAGEPLRRADLPCELGAIGLGILTIEFITALPRRPPLPPRRRAALWAWSGAGAALLALAVRGDVPMAVPEWGYYTPVTLVIFALGGAAWRRTADRDARTVIAMLWLRWGWGLLAYKLARPLGLFQEALWIESTAVTLVSFVGIGTAVLRSELFSIRSSAAEAVTIATLGLAVVLGGGAAVWAAQAYAEPGALQQALLVGATLVPLGLAAIARALYPRVERRVLAGLDERRARRLGVQGEPLPAEPAAAIAEAARRVAAIGDGAVARWVPAAALPGPLALALRDGEPLRREEAPALPAALAVPALGGDRALAGALYLDGGLIDRDTYLVARDLAARVALAVERAEAVSALEDARRLAALGQFAAAIAHDIRTPLTSISLNVQILRRKLQLSDDDREHLDIALEELARLDRSVAEILDFAKPLRLAAEAVDVGELLEAAARGLYPVLAERGVELHCEPAPLAVQGDAARLRQVLANLVGNAAEASPRGARVTVRASAAEGGRVAIDVEDRGRGIGADDLPRIFEPFFTTRPDGTGLGLAICHKVVRAHGGDIRVRSAPGQGSTFTVLLPAADDAGADADAA